VTTIATVSGTAFVVAEFRAEENRAPRPLYRDTVVELFLTDESKRAARQIAAAFPLAKDLVPIRTRYFDDVLDQQLRSNVRQVVILGSGLDTRAVRKAAAGVTYYEIDDPATLEMKRAGYEEQGLALDLTFIPGDYVTDGLIDLLDENGFDFTLPTYIIWEGNTMYLPRQRVISVLTELRRHLIRFRVSFDYMAEAVIAKTTGDAGVTRFVESFARMGAPWVSGIRDIRSFAREVGLTVFENVQADQLYTIYRRRRRVRSPIFHFYSVCTLGQ
jgi:methyltransferase (TIGR00027 family)